MRSATSTHRWVWKKEVAPSHPTLHAQVRVGGTAPLPRTRGTSLGRATQQAAAATAEGEKVAVWRILRAFQNEAARLTGRAAERGASAECAKAVHKSLLEARRKAA